MLKKQSIFFSAPHFSGNTIAEKSNRRIGSCREFFSTNLLHGLPIETLLKNHDEDLL